SVTPIILVPYLGTIFPSNPWPATLVIALAAAAHQGWSANLFSTTGDMFPSSAVSSVVGFGGAFGALGGAISTAIIKRSLSLHAHLVCVSAGVVYLIATDLIQVLVPCLGIKERVSGA